VPVQGLRVVSGPSCCLDPASSFETVKLLTISGKRHLKIEVLTKLVDELSRREASWRAGQGIEQPEWALRDSPYRRRT
jgi:hypothetical protein